MNLILLQADEIDSLTDEVWLRDRRAQHIRDVHQPQPGDWLRVGVVEGDITRAQVLTLNQQGVRLRLDTDGWQPPPAPLPLILVLALPRPKMLRRVLQSIASMGVKEIWLIHSYRVDKSYWSSPLLAEAAIHEQLLLGLEQAGDTRLPRVQVRRRFKPFVEDELPQLASERRALVAHPYQADPCPVAQLTPTLLAIGPEGGFIPYEVDKLGAAGLRSISLGSRILRVETAVPVVLARLFPPI